MPEPKPPQGPTGEPEEKIENKKDFNFTVKGFNLYCEEKTAEQANKLKTDLEKALNSLSLEEMAILQKGSTRTPSPLYFTYRGYLSTLFFLKINEVKIGAWDASSEEIAQFIKNEVIPTLLEDHNKTTSAQIETTQATSKSVPPTPPLSSQPSLPPDQPPVENSFQHPEENNIGNLEADLEKLEEELDKNNEEGQENRALIERLKGELLQIAEREKERKENPFLFFLVDQMSEKVSEIIFGTTRENVSLEMLGLIGVLPEKPEEFFLRKFKLIAEDKENTFYFTTNGFTLRLLNKKELWIKEDGKNVIDIYNLTARYELFFPDGKSIKKDMPHEEACKLIKNEAEKYQNEQKARFDAQNKSR